MSTLPTPLLRQLGLRQYELVWRRMQALNQSRDASTRDEIWFLEHYPVYTLGMNADAAHVLVPGDIPVIDIDRGGQVTYHGPGQLVVYPMIDLKRLDLGVRALVTALEQSIIGLAFNIDMDLEPFQRINPCGFRGLEVTQLKTVGGPADLAVVQTDLARQLLANLGYNAPPEISFADAPQELDQAS